VSKPFLSVIIPALNEEQCLPVLLSSLVSQTDKDFEVVVSDGQSEDKTKEKAMEFKHRLDIKVFTSDKRQLAHQRNFGAKKAGGEYLIFLDADYRAKETFIEFITKEIHETNADLVIPVSIPDTNSLLWKIYFAVARFFIPFMSLINKPVGNASAVVIRKEVFDKIGGYDETVFVYEDQFLLQTARKYKVKMVFSKDAKVYFSLRRIKSQGALNYLFTDYFAGLHLIFLGPLRKKFYEYKMGGQAHK
jgi:glycosyltransferase involved in cell wall biosynthesis